MRPGPFSAVVYRLEDGPIATCMRQPLWSMGTERRGLAAQRHCPVRVGSSGCVPKEEGVGCQTRRVAAVPGGAVGGVGPQPNKMY